MLSIQRSPGSGHAGVDVPGDNRKVYVFGPLGWRGEWFDGRIAMGQIAHVFCEQMRAAVARSTFGGRVAIIIADNLKTHTAEGFLLVRRMLTERSDQLSLAYMPAYDLDANVVNARRSEQVLPSDMSTYPPT